MHDYLITGGLNEMSSRQIVIKIRRHKPFSQRTPCNSNVSEPEVSRMSSLSSVRRSCADTNTGLTPEQITHFLLFIAVQNKK